MTLNISAMLCVCLSRTQNLILIWCNLVLVYCNELCGMSHRKRGEIQPISCVVIRAAQLTVRFLLRRVKTKLNFKAEKLNTYRFCDNVWTFMLNDVDFKELSEFGTVDRVKIVACDAKAATLPANRYDD